MVIVKDKWSMFLNFVEVDHKLIMAWFGSGFMVLANKFGFDILEYELWKVVTLDILTAIMMVVAIGYTIARWRKLHRERKQK